MAGKVSGGGSGGGEASIWRLVAREMGRQGFSEEQRANARALLNEFLLRRRPRVVRPEVYAAAVEYTIARADLLDHFTQADVASRHGVSVRSISRVHTDMVQSLGIELFDPRYCSITPVLSGPEALTGDQHLLDEMRDLHGWEDPLFLEHPTIEQLRALPVAIETWGGARRTLRSYVVSPRPFRPDLVLWANEDTREILGQRLLYPDDNMDPVLSSLMDAMLEPAVGRARRPARILVDDTALARRLSVVLKPAGVEVAVGETPGVHAAVQFLEASMSVDAPRSSYLEDGRLSLQLLARFFDQAAAMARARPWELVQDDQVCSVDLYRWGVERVTVAVMGNGGLERGLLIFSSLRDFRRFLRLARQADRTGCRVNNLQVDLLVLTLHKGTELGKHRLKEVLKHEWEVDDAGAYPELVHLDPDNIAVPLREEDYLVSGACAQAVAALYADQGEVFASRGAWRKVPRVTARVEVEGEPVMIAAPHAEL